MRTYIRRRCSIRVHAKERGSSGQRFGSCRRRRHGQSLHDDRYEGK